MFITYKEFKDLIQDAINCLVTPSYTKYRLSNGLVVYKVFENESSKMLVLKED